MSQPTYRLLGPLEAEQGGKPVSIGGQKQRAVLALLLLRAGEVVSSDRLIEDLWGENPPRTAATSLQNAVSQLRKALGAETLMTRAPGYLVDIDKDQVDAHRFERLVRRARGEDPEPRARLLREALELWRGPALADFTYESFAQGEIKRLEDLQLAALEERIDAELELGRAAELVGELEALVDQNPLRERLRGQLMLALYRSGRQAEALQAYQQARQVLVDELGIEPSPALQQLHGAVLRQESGLQPVAAGPPAEDHFLEVARAILSGRLVAVLGSGVNRSGRPEGAAWDFEGAMYAPDSAEVAAYLARRFECPPDQAGQLARVSQYVAVMKGSGPLYDELHAVFDADFPPGPVHRFFADLAAQFGAGGGPHPLIVSTNYDAALERAFAEAGVELDVVSYIASGSNRGRFLHRRPDGSCAVVETPNTYVDVSPEQGPVLLKLHGQVDREPARAWESFVVSEDDYIDYLVHTDIATVMPVKLAAKLRRSHLLFLGYDPLDWNLRVFLHRMWGAQSLSYRSWAVRTGTESVEPEFWRRRDVDVVDAPLEQYLEELRACVETLATAEAVG
jgi:DNA-binding SARP family transcriptional activator